MQSSGPCLINYTSGTITIGLSLISVVNSDSQNVCLNTPINDITYTIVGADPLSPPTVIGLPDGVTGSLTSPGVFTILGTPTVAGLHTYTVNANGTCGIPASLIGEITVGLGLVSVNGINLDSQIVCLNTPIINIEYNHI